jgi:hypothetical protein
MTKALIFDSGAIINLSMNGLLYILEELKKDFEGRFIITEEVKYEVIDRPIKVQRFELEALRVQQLLKEKVLEPPESLGISNSEIQRETKNLLEIANHTISSNGRWVEVVSGAEMSCLALNSILQKKGIECIIAIDERTTRILSEKPENLKKIMSDKLHMNISLAEGNLEKLSNFKFIRSSEIGYVAFKKNLLHLKDKKALEAVLYATKFKGSSISFDEINELKNL